jgi:hypothetical protein
MGKEDRARRVGWNFIALVVTLVGIGIIGTLHEDEPRNQPTVHCTYTSWNNKNICTSGY